jgi:hypothetical protein
MYKQTYIHTTYIHTGWNPDELGRDLFRSFLVDLFVPKIRLRERERVRETFVDVSDWSTYIHMYKHTYIHTYIHTGWDSDELGRERVLWTCQIGARGREKASL